MGHQRFNRITHYNQIFRERNHRPQGNGAALFLYSPSRAGVSVRASEQTRNAEKVKDRLGEAKRAADPTGENNRIRKNTKTEKGKETWHFLARNSRLRSF